MLRAESLKQLKMIIFDVDGVFTDGRAWQAADGSQRRAFSVRDTMGIRALRKAGYKIGVISSAEAEEIRAHVGYVGVDSFVEAKSDRSRALASMLAEFGVDSSEACFVTDLEADKELLLGVGFSVALPSASDETQRAARFVTSRNGGDGAVLEISNLILQHKNIRELHL